MKHKLRYAILLFLLLTLSQLSFPRNIAYSQPFFCKDFYLVYARGSGELVGKSKGWERFDAQLKYRLTNYVSFQTYELGSLSQNGHQYPAVDVSHISNGNAIGAWLSAGAANDYGNSVNEGSLELASYFAKVNFQCPESRFILSGYSQGAQVVGGALRSLPKDATDKIEFVALFGDPKLNLPEGRGFNPPACDGRDFSPWRRVIGNCDTDSGSLGARHPYLPPDLEPRVGLWCLSKDLVCGSTNNFLNNSGHGEYPNSGGPIDLAALEIANRLKSTNPTVDIRPKVGDEVIGPDVMIVLDNSRTMFSTYYSQNIRSKIISIGQAATAAKGRVGLITYCGCSAGSPVYNAPLSTDANNLFFALSPLEFDRSVSNLSLALEQTIKNVQATTPWRPGAKRVIIPITNTAYTKPLSFHPATLASFQPSTLSEQAAYIYPIVNPDIAASFNDLSLEGFETFPSPQMTIEATTETVVARLDSQLLAFLTSNDYKAHPNKALIFSASSSLAHDDEINKYEWDFNGDNVIDQITSQPTVSHAYPTEFTGIMTVKVSTINGLTDTDSATVKIASDLSQQTTKAPAGLKVEATSETTAHLSWNSSDEPITGWAILINDITLGRTASNQTYIDISDLKRNEDIVFGVQAITANGELGEKAIATLVSGHTSANGGYYNRDADEQAPLATVHDQSPTIDSGVAGLRTFLVPATIVQAAKTYALWIIGYIIAGIILASIVSIVIVRRGKSLK